jgi:ubiquinone/menaquinone biosynthesis C-methylase UbiE
MELNTQTQPTNGNGNGHLLITRKSRSIKTDSVHNGHISIFDPNKDMLKLPKTRKVSLPNGQVRFGRSEACYLPGSRESCLVKEEDREAEDKAVTE